MNEITGLHNHPSIILEKLWKAMFFIVVVFIGSINDFIEAAALIKAGNVWEGLLAAGGGFLIIVLIVLWNIIRWYKTTITIKDGTIEIERRTLNRNINTIAVQNISNINLEQNIFEMIIGTYKLKLDTSSLSTAETTDVEIVLKKKDAYDVKNLIMQMMQEINASETDKASFGTDVSAVREAVLPMQEIPDNEYDIIYTTKEIIMSCFVCTNILLVLITIGLIISSIISITATIKTTEDVISLIAAGIFQLFAGGSFIAVIIKSWLSAFAFRAKRCDNKVYVSCGLVKKRKYAVPVDTINAVYIESTVLGRIFKRASVKVINIGGEGDDVAGMQLLLAGTEKELKEKLAVLLPEYTFPEHTKVKRQPVKVFWCKIVCSVIFTACFMLGLWIGIKVMQETLPNTVWAVIPVCIMLLSIVGNVLAYRVNGLHVDEQYLVISQGMFAKKIKTIPYGKIQYITQKTGPLERLMHVKHANISILASAAYRSNPIKSFPVSEFDKIHEYMKKTY